MLLKSLVFVAGVATTAAKVEFMGMNIAGFEFGCQIDGSCPTSSVTPPLSTLGGGDGAGQMQHFVNDDQMNIFRLPVSWQFLVNNKLGGTLDSTNFGKYDQLMQSCLSTGAYCAIDLHNFARFNGNIIGQSSDGPSDAQFADLWTQLATRYKSDTKVVFGLMNEPHDVDIVAWANTVQLAVTGIRNVGTSTQMILLPGNNFTSAATFVSNGSGAALIKVANPDGSTDGLILDIHKYLDVDNSGTHSDCTTDNISDAFSPVAAFLRQSGRQAICFMDFCAQNAFLNQNSDVFLGYVAWGAGSFATSYTLSLTPSKLNGRFVDNALASQCVISPWLSAGTAIVTSAIASNTATATAISSPNNQGLSITAPASVGTSVLLGTSSSTMATSPSGNGNANSVTQSALIASPTSGLATSVSRTSMTTTGIPASAPSQLANVAKMEEISWGIMAVMGAIIVAALLR
ncbi:Endoglucanase EG-II [Lachnellula arida]|uniref:Endoglucanase EG-II n=1 Tax=Lachnellula arida TaxID=1316785 RepID=A0A8T9B684_9HELO|nr:Endoglucanase EG-II [Lachnellula arida]